MSRTRCVSVLVGVLALAALVAVPAFASGGGPGGGGGGGSACAPLTMIVRLGHSDGSGNSAIGVQATIRNCSNIPEAMTLNVSVPGSTTVPFSFSTSFGRLQPGQSLTMNASPIGSTPLQLHYGQTYDVVGTLSETAPTPGTLATVTTPVTMPQGVVQ